MKRRSLLLLMLVSIHTVLICQKYDRETINYNCYHLPVYLIYDQVKTTGTKVVVESSRDFNADVNQAKQLFVPLKSYKDVGYTAADLKIDVSLGPYSFVDEKTTSSTKTETVNGTKKSVTSYQRIIRYSFPGTYTAINARNGKILMKRDLPADYLELSSGDYATEAEATKGLENMKSKYITEALNARCRTFAQTCNADLSDYFDFYPRTMWLDVFKFRKWDQQDEYNAHIDHFKKVIELMTADEDPLLYKEKVKADLDYFASFENKFDPKDKKEDRLYFGNYFNLGVVWFCLNDMEKANFYLNKLDSIDEKERLTGIQKDYIANATRRMQKHFLKTVHLDYNPVTDFRLKSEQFISDAASSSEATTAKLSTGKISSFDKVVFKNGDKAEGKINVENGDVKFYPKDDPAHPIELTKSKTGYFTKDAVSYFVGKSDVNNGTMAKYFFEVKYNSPEILLLLLVNDDLSVQAGPAYFFIYRPGEEEVMNINGTSLKKKLTEYFKNCPKMQEGIDSGEFVPGLLSGNKLPKFLAMCTKYSESCK